MILVKLNKSLLVFREDEFLRLVAKDKQLWATAIRRGKYLLRRRAEERRGNVARATILR